MSFNFFVKLSYTVLQCEHLVQKEKHDDSRCLFSSRFIGWRAFCATNEPNSFSFFIFFFLFLFFNLLHEAVARTNSFYSPAFIATESRCMHFEIICNSHPVYELSFFCIVIVIIIIIIVIVLQLLWLCSYQCGLFFFVSLSFFSLQRNKKKKKNHFAPFCITRCIHIITTSGYCDYYVLCNLLFFVICRSNALSTASSTNLLIYRNKVRGACKYVCVQNATREIRVSPWQRLSK